MDVDHQNYIHPPLQLQLLHIPVACGPLGATIEPAMSGTDLS